MDHSIRFNKAYFFLYLMVFAVLLTPLGGIGQGKSATPVPTPVPKPAAQPRPANTPPQKNNQIPAAQSQHNASVGQQRNVPKAPSPPATVQSQPNVSSRNKQLPKATPTPSTTLQGKQKVNPNLANPPGKGPSNPSSAVQPVSVSHTIMPAPSERRPIFIPPSTAKATKFADGGAMYRGPGGRQWQVNQDKQLVRYSKSGVEAKFDHRGQLAEVHIAHHDGEIVIHHATNGNRHIEVVRPDHSRLVSFAPNRGYVEHRIPSRSGYVARNYVVDGKSSIRVYRTYQYQNITYYQFVPVAYYSPLFYRWINSRWSTPVTYAGDWDGQPWAAANQQYFAPDSSYSTPDALVTDYVIEEDLKLAFEGQDSTRDEASPMAGGNGDSMPITPQVKQVFAREVGSEVTEMEIEAKSAGAVDPKSKSDVPEQVPSVLNPEHRLLMISTNQQVTTTSGETCLLTGGDMIVRTGNEIVEGDKVEISVLASRPGDCPYNVAAKIELAALQEQSNEMRAQIHSGISMVANKQGTHGIPPGPDSALHGAPEGYAPADADAGNQLHKLQQEAEKAESDIRQNTASAGAN